MGKEQEMANEIKTKQAAQGNNPRRDRKTVVGVFSSAGPVDEVVREIEALGLSRNEVQSARWRSPKRSRSAES